MAASSAASKSKGSKNVSTPTDKKAKFRPKLLIIFTIEVILATAVLFVLLYGGYYWTDCIPVPSNSTDLTTRLSYTIRWSLPMILSLFVAVLAVTFKRGTNPKLATPLFGNDSLMQVDKNVLQNTLEQFCISLPLLLIASTYFDCPQLLKFIPLYSITFVVGRVCFRIGYGIHSLYCRSFGMMINAFSTMLLTGLVIYSMYTRGVMYGLGPVVYPVGCEGGGEKGERVEL